MIGLYSAVILAGGKSSRMGVNKALVNILGKPLLSWAVDSLLNIVDDLIVVAKNKEDFKLYKKILPGTVQVVSDNFDMEGPLVGMVSGFKVVKSDYCYVHPVDSPIIKNNVIEYLFESAQNYDGAVWKKDDVIEPLHAVYCVRPVLKISEKILQIDKNTSAKILSEKIRLNYVGIEKLRSMDKDLVSLFNINTPDDVKFASNYIKTHDVYI